MVSVSCPSFVCSCCDNGPDKRTEMIWLPITSQEEPATSHPQHWEPIKAVCQCPVLPLRIQCRAQPRRRYGPHHISTKPIRESIIGMNTGQSNRDNPSLGNLSKEILNYISLKIKIGQVWCYMSLILGRRRQKKANL